jgi:hypothetical protein
MNSGSLGWMNLTPKSKRIARQNKAIEELAQMVRDNPALFSKVVKWRSLGRSDAEITEFILNEVEPESGG